MSFHGDRFDPKAYRRRMAEGLVEKALTNSPGVAIVGARGNGKTWLASFFARSAIYFSEGGFALGDVKKMLEAPMGGVPLLLDEWQLLEGIYLLVINRIEETGLAPAQFILTGSSSTKRMLGLPRSFMRLTVVHIGTMSLYESGDSSGRVSLSGILRGEFKECDMPEMTLERIGTLILRGGWPISVDKSDEQAFITADRYPSIILGRAVQETGMDGRELSKDIYPP